MVAVAKLEIALEIADSSAPLAMQRELIPFMLLEIDLMMGFQFVTPPFGVGGSFLPASYGRP